MTPEFLRVFWAVSIALEVLVSLATAPGAAQDRARAAPDTADPSAALATRDRLRAREAAILREAEYEDELTPAQRRSLRALDCPWALAVAAMTAEERAAVVARENVDPSDPALGHEERSQAQSARLELESSGLDRALVRADACASTLSRARVHLALGSDRGVHWLERAVRARERGAAALEASLSAPQRELYALLREMDGDVSRARASSLAQLATVLGLFIGERCQPRAPGPRYPWDGSEPAAEPVAGIALLTCQTGRPGFHEDFDYAIVTLVVHVGSDGARVVDRLRDVASHNAGAEEGERVLGALVQGAIVVMETELGHGLEGIEDQPEVARAGLLVCSGTSGRCRRVDLGSGASRARWTLAGSTLALLDPGSFSVLGAVDVERWVAREAELVTAPPREEPASALVPGAWSAPVRDLTELEGCWFSVIDADGALNVRAQPSARSPVLGTVARGLVVRPAELRPGWARITAPVAGWLHRAGVERTCIEVVAERLAGATGDGDDEGQDEEP